MKFNTMDNTPSGALFTNMLALFSFLASVIANPILTSGAADSLAPRATCRLGTCGLGIQCFKANSCVGVNLLNPNWTHCSICSCPGRAYGGRTDPTCIIDTECLNVQLGNRPDPCGHKGHSVGGREASPEPAPQKGNGGVIDPNAIIKNIPDKIPYSTATANYIASLPEGSYIDPDILKNIKDELAEESFAVNARSDLGGREASPEPAPQKGNGGVIDPNAINKNIPDKIPYSTTTAEYIASLPEGSYIDPDILKNIKDELAESFAVNARSDLMNEFARLVDDGPGGPITPDAAMLESLRPISHPEKHGGCYTVKNGVTVEKRGGCSNVKDDIDIDSDIDVDLRKRGGCYTVENGVAVEKRGGCGTVEVDIDVDAGLDIDFHKRGGCYKIENGVIVEKRGGCGTVEGDIDINSDIDIDLHKRGGCYPIENGVAVEKRGGCGTVEGDIDIDGDIDVDLHTRGGCFTVENGVRVEKQGGCGSLELEVEAVVEKRVGCFVEEGGVVYAKPNCDGPSHFGPPFPRDA